MTPGTPDEVRRALARLGSDDPVRPMVELVFEVEDPAVTSAILRKLLDEVRRQKGGRPPGRGE